MKLGFALTAFVFALLWTTTANAINGMINGKVVLEVQYPDEIVSIPLDDFFLRFGPIGATDYKLFGHGTAHEGVFESSIPILRTLDGKKVGFSALSDFSNHAVRIAPVPPSPFSPLPDSDTAITLESTESIPSILDYAEKTDLVLVLPLTEEIANNNGYAGVAGLANIWVQMNAAFQMTQQVRFKSRDLGLFNFNRMPQLVVVGVKKQDFIAYQAQKNTITFNPAANLDNSTLLHEYGHALFEQLYGPYSYTNQDCRDLHRMAFPIDSQCAFIEGWASFFATVVTSANTFEPDGIFQYTQQPFDLNPKVSQIVGDCLDSGTTTHCERILSFGRDLLSVKNPKDEANTAAILWRLFKYGGMPLQTHFRALQLMSETGVANKDLTLINYLPCLAKAAAATSSHRDSLYSDVEQNIELEKVSLTTILGPFAVAQSAFAQPGNCKK